MTPDDPMLRLQYYKETGQSDEAQKYEQYLRETGQFKETGPKKTPPPKVTTPSVDSTDEEPGYLSRFTTHVLNTAQGIPGMESIEAGAGVLGSHLTNHPLTYEQSLATLRDATGNIGGKTSAVEKLMGSLPLTALRAGSLVPRMTSTVANAGRAILPRSPVVLGAILGGADQALSADTDQSPVQRALRTAAGTAGGAILGKAADVGVAGARTLLAKNPAANLLERQAARALSAKRLYGAAMLEGQGKGATPEIQAFLDEPDIKEIVSELQQTRPFHGVQASDPQMLDAVYKTLSDRAATVKRGLESVTPTRPNIGRFRGADIAQAKSTALGAMDTTMPTYRDAVTDFANQSREMDALKQGYEALRGTTKKNLPTAKNLTRTTPEAFSDFLKNLPPAEGRASVEGVLGGAKSAMSVSPFKLGRRALMNAPSLIRATEPASEDIGSLLARLGTQTGRAWWQR